eukprot:GILI01007274.1.p1 GENE.GILI01007274.1~~GILI01007274.1.p1  ORF type:complete len:555 (-),score=139.98 GILI01007274.1:300-1919(-)
MATRILTAAAATSAFLFTVAAAEKGTFPCTQDWTGPNYNNTFSCNGDQVGNWIEDNSEVWGSFIPAAIGILVLFPISFVLIIGRYCCNCCGSSKQRPSQFCCGGASDDELSESELISKYSSSCVFLVKFFSIFIAFMGITGVTLTYLGGAKIDSGVKDVTPTVDTIASWALGIISDVKAGIADPTNSSDYPIGFNVSQFDSVISDINRYHHDISSDINEYKDPISRYTKYPAYVAAVPAVFMLLPAIAAIFKIRRGLPIFFIVWSFLLQFVYLVLATICLILFFAFNIVCDDLSTVNTGERSITEWYLIPRCDHEAPFQSIVDNVHEIERDNSISGCQTLLNFCSTTEIYDAATAPMMVFYCNLTDANTQCTNVESVTAIVNAMHIKTGAPENCGNASVPCTLARCATDCQSTSTRDAASQAVSLLNTANRVVNAINNILLPWLDCSALLGKIMNLGAKSTCKTLKDGTNYLRVGALVLGIGLLLEIFFGFLGQKRYINKSRGSDEMYALSDKIGGYNATDRYSPKNGPGVMNREMNYN